MFGIETISKYVEDKVADYGASVIMSAVASSPIGAAFAAANRFSDFIESGGLSEVRGLVQVPKLRFQGMDLLQKLQNSISNPTKIPAWKRKAPWATSRQDYLENAWRHDWRSQPRNKIGEWIPGRLPYPVLTAKRVGKGKQRTARQRRMARYRRYGRAAARSIKYGD